MTLDPTSIPEPSRPSSRSLRARLWTLFTRSLVLSIALHALALGWSFTRALSSDGGGDGAGDGSGLDGDGLGPTFRISIRGPGAGLAARDVVVDRPFEVAAPEPELSVAEELPLESAPAEPVAAEPRAIAPSEPTALAAAEREPGVWTSISIGGMKLLGTLAQRAAEAPLAAVPASTSAPVASAAAVALPRGEPGGGGAREAGPIPGTGLDSLARGSGSRGGPIGGGGGGTRANAEPLVVRAPAPAYPELAQRRGEEGTVLLRIFVRPDGTVRDVAIETSSGYARLDEAAVSAVRRWIFRPAEGAGAALERNFVHPVTFRLEARR